VKNILILGGTKFIGRNLVERLLLDPQNKLMLLNRGITNSDLFPNVQKLKGDRNSQDVGELVKGNWDYVIDLSCYYPQGLEYVLNALSYPPKKYIFISTCSVYQEGNALQKETAKIQKGNANDWIDESNETYGKRKSRCEEILKNHDINFTILRPTLVYGKYDHTDRFYYWLHQVKSYNEILIPNHGLQIFSLSYVNDLIETICLAMNEKFDRNIYNAISCVETNLSEIVEIASNILNKQPSIVNISSEDLSLKQISQRYDMPLWIDADKDTYCNDKVLNKFKQSITPLMESIIQAINYYEQLKWPVPKYGIDRTKQLDLLAYVKKRN
jgi:2'-hydroxyisoflavone reductase